MPRTLAQVDADLATVEAALATLTTRINNLQQAGQVLRADVNAVRPDVVQAQNDITALYLQIGQAQSAGQAATQALRNDAVAMVRKIKKAVQRDRGASLPQDDNPRPHANPLVEKVLVRGKVVARSRLAR